MDRPFLKYLLVGLANTALTAVIIFILTSFGLNIFVANAMGYIAGIILSYTLNSIFTFNTKLSASSLIKFLIVCLISYAMNLVFMKSFLYLFPEKIYIAQLVGVVAYTITGFILNKFWALK